MKSLVQLLPIIVLVAVFWFLIVRPARRRQRDVAQTQAELGVGTEIMLTSGIFGTVVAIGDESLDLQIAPGIVITVHRQAVGRIVTERPDTIPDGADD